MTSEDHGVFTQTFTDRFDSAHRLIDYDGPCANLHGHGYTVTIIIKTDYLPDGKFVIDYNELKAILKPYDHVTLTWKEDKALIQFVESQKSGIKILSGQSTTEYLSMDIARNVTLAMQELNQAFDPGNNPFHAVTVNVRETPKGSCSYSI